MSAKRDKIDIILEILQACSDGASKTNIVYQANLNFRTVTSYLDHLMDKGMIETRHESTTLYIVTGKGLKLMKDLRSIREKISDVH